MLQYLWTLSMAAPPEALFIRYPSSIHCLCLPIFPSASVPDSCGRDGQTRLLNCIRSGIVHGGLGEPFNTLNVFDCSE